ncbi:MAG: hypothetical protein JNK90_18965 [Planctomycetaceae bacterium]|nr:hypothetical protein [Planctomycetaceae bacterium]
MSNNTVKEKNPGTHSMRGKGENPFATNTKTRGVRFSLRFLLLLNAVFTCSAAALAFVSRVPAVSEEISAWMGQANTASGGDNRTAQVIFVFAVYAMPLFMATLVWLFGLTIGWIQRVMPRPEPQTDD